MRRWGTLSQPTGCGPGDHVCWIHAEQEEWRAVATDYLGEGARGHEQLLYVADGDPADLLDHLSGLAARDELATSGQLQVRPLAEVFGPAAVPNHAASHVEVSLARTRGGDGGGRLRIATELSALAATEAAGSLVSVELLMDRLAASSPVSLLCGYDEGIGATATMASAVHPLRGGGAHPSFRLFADDGDGGWRLTGEVDLEEWEAFEAALAALPADGDVHLECAELEFIDVRGARALVERAARLGEGRRLVLRDPPRVLRQILDVGWPGAPAVEVADR